MLLNSILKYQNNKRQDLIHKLLPNSTHRFRPAKIASLWAIVMCCTRATWTKFVSCISELGLQCFFQNWSHTIGPLLWWQLIFDDYQFWSGQYCWNRYQRQCSIQTCLAFFLQIFLWLFYFHHFFKYFYCIFPSILTLGTQYPQNRDIWKRPVVRHLKMKSEHFWSPVWVLETK